MKIIDYLQISYDNFQTRVNEYLSSVLNKYSTKNSSIFSQLINVLGSVTQNILSYLEDSLTEQNKFTASRKRSIYNLASISGYDPSLGNATSLVIKVLIKPNNYSDSKVIIPNKTKLICSANGLIYNMLLPQESVILDLSKAMSKYFTLVEGQFEHQQFISSGGQLYTQNVKFNKDCDLNYINVFVNNELFEKVDCLYDMMPDAKQYVVKTSLKKGIDILFGNGQFGYSLKEGDVIRVEYLLHNGEDGNINIYSDPVFTFNDTLQLSSSDYVDASEILSLSIENADMVNSGSNSESLEQVKAMIGFNSRNLVLTDPKNYKQFFSKFSFCGYNRTWSEPGSLIITSLILRNIKILNKDYFSLKESDFLLSDTQKQSIINYINNSGQQLAGTLLNIIDPVLTKYCMYVYIKMKDVSYNTDEITNKVRKVIGDFFMDIHNDYFIPKSDIILLIKNTITEIDSVDIYFLNENNEKAIINKEYINQIFSKNPSTNTYNSSAEKIYLLDGENPNLGFDEHGNILLTNPNEFPILMGGWQFVSNKEDNQLTTIIDPVTIIFE